MNLKNALTKILSFLRVQSKIGGLEISDSAVRFAYFAGGSLKTLSLRLPTGIIENGEIKNYGLLVEALQKLRGLIPADFGNKKIIDVIVTLGSVRIYTQVFSLPLVEEKDLKEAIQLNIKMVSPLDLSQAYAGWQLINQNKNELKIEILSAFAQKAFVDMLRNALNEAGFFAIAVESGGLSFTRLIREHGLNFRTDKPFLVLSIDDRGLRFMVIRLGYLHFEYFQSWKDIQGDEKEISWENFEEEIKRNLHQVLNFYGSHWPEPLTEVVIASSTLVNEISKAISENFSVNVSELRFNLGQPLQREWYEVAGSAVRGETPREEDEDINLFGMTVQEEFYQQRIMDFVGFWRILIPSSLAILVVFLFITRLFLGSMSKSLESQSSLRLNPQQAAEIASISSKIKEFNKSVSLLSKIQGSMKPKTDIIDKLTLMMNINGIVANRVYFQSEEQPIDFSGEAESQEKILSFKNALSQNPAFTSVNLNLSDIKQSERGFSFTITFSLKR